jgi:hypothetical protein
MNKELHDRYLAEKHPNETYEWWLEKCLIDSELALKYANLDLENANVDLAKRDKNRVKLAPAKTRWHQLLAVAESELRDASHSVSALCATGFRDSGNESLEQLSSDARLVGLRLAELRARITVLKEK